MIQAKLLPCPFCGGKAFIRAYRPYGDQLREEQFEIGCASDGGDCGFPHASFTSEGEAVRRWNRRPESKKESKS